MPSINRKSSPKLKEKALIPAKINKSCSCSFKKSYNFSMPVIMAVIRFVCNKNFEKF